MYTYVCIRYVYLCVHTDIHINVQAAEYTFCCLFMYDVKADHFAFDNQWEGSFQRQAHSPPGKKRVVSTPSNCILKQWFMHRFHLFIILCIRVHTCVDMCTWVQLPVEAGMRTADLLGTKLRSSRRTRMSHLSNSHRSFLNTTGLGAQQNRTIVRMLLE